MRPNYANGLQKGVDNGSADKFHTAPSQVGRDGVGQWRRSWAALDYGFVVAKMPNVTIERAEFLLNFEEDLRILHGCSNFLPIAHDGGIVTENIDFCVVVGSHGGTIEPIERSPKSLAFVQNALPRQSRLKTLQNEHFEKLLVVMHRHAPFAVVIRHIERILQIAPVATMDLLFGIHAAKIQKMRSETKRNFLSTKRM